MSDFIEWLSGKTRFDDDYQSNSVFQQSLDKLDGIETRQSEQFGNLSEQLSVLEKSYETQSKQLSVLQRSYETEGKQLQVLQDENTKLTTLYTAVIKQAADNKKDADKKFIISTLIAVVSLIVAIVALFL